MNKILIIDDHPDNRRFVRIALELVGYQLIEAGDGAQGVAMAQQELPDLVLMDAMMPVMDGYQACEQLKSRESTRDIPVIFLTAAGEADNEIRALAAGAVDFIAKPIHLALLRARVKLHLGMRKQWLELQELNRRLQQSAVDIQRSEQALAQALRRELDIAAAIQQSLLFGKPPAELEGFSVASYTEASQGVDGDFYAFTQLSGSSFEILTGDVMGKGIAAALIAASVESVYRKIFSESMAAQRLQALPTPADLVNAIHAAVTPELIRLESFVTLLLIRFDRQQQTVTWVNAGHTPTLLARRSTQQVLELPCDDLPLGVLEKEVYREQVTSIDVGDKLLLYSDGLSEAVDQAGRQYGLERLKQMLQMTMDANATIALNSLRCDLHAHTCNRVLSDDCTAIVVQMDTVRYGERGSVADRRAPEYLDLPRALDKLEPLRRRIAALGADQPEELVQALVLAAFEAATNIVRHSPVRLSNAPMTAILSRNAEFLSVELVYEGQPYVPQQSPKPDFSGQAEGGFGLFIIENCVDRVEYGSPLPGMASMRLIKNIGPGVPPA